MKRVLSLFFAVLLIMVSVPAITFAEENDYGSLLNLSDAVSQFMTQNNDEEKVADVLACLNNQTYTDTMTSLLNGEVISFGQYSYAAAGLQQTLVDLGCMISIDGSAGNGTFEALNNILTSVGAEATNTVDADIYWYLLALVLINNYPDMADAVLPKYFASDGNGSQYLYVKASLLFAQNKYYRAMVAFWESQYGDWEDRVAQCQLPWPSNGEYWHNSNYNSQEISLIFVVNSYDESEGKCFEVYTSDDILVSVLFLTGSGTVATLLPGGTYKIKNASGTEWYGPLDAFGPNGHYEYMEFDEDRSNPYLTHLYAGYDWTITVNVSEPDPETDMIETVYSNWADWTD